MTADIVGNELHFLFRDRDAAETLSRGICTFMRQKQGFSLPVEGVVCWINHPEEGVSSVCFNKDNFLALTVDALPKMNVLRTSMKQFAEPQQSVAHG